MNLKDLLHSVDVIDSINDKQLNIQGIAYHSKLVEEGFLFVCIKGYEVDGHHYLESAKNNGAIAAIVEEFQNHIDIPQYKVSNARKVLAIVSSTFYDNPSKKLNMIGISATNGKTSTAFMTNAIFEQHNFISGLIGTVHVKIGDEKIPATLTTPMSLDLHYYFQQMINARTSHAIMEVSSAAIEMNRIDTIDYDIVTLNNISSEHIDTHGSFDRYFEMKSKLITEAKKDAFAILNLDCPYSRSLIDKTKASVITYGIEDQTGHITCKNVQLSTGRASFTVEIRKKIKTKYGVIDPQQFDLELSISGLHSVYNSLVATTIALLENVPVETIQKALSTFKGVERRFQVIYDDGFTIIDDHFANRGNINVTLNTLTAMDFNKLHLVYAIRGNRGIDVNRENAETIVEWAKKLNLNSIIATKSISNVTRHDKVSFEEEKVFLETMEKASINVDLYDELEDAIVASLQNVQSQDLILFAGCQGMDDGAKIAYNLIDKMLLDKSPLV